MPKKLNLSGHRYGRLLVKSEAEPGVWLCLCDCGSERLVKRNQLRKGDAKSCGCIRREVASQLNKSHGKSNTPEHVVWKRMRARCYRETHPDFPNYGGRGIKICKTWEEFKNFIADMGKRPTPEHSIERKDVNGNYCKENCEWATSEIQADNKTTTIRLSLGAVTKTITQWAKETGLPRTTLRARLRRGWDHEKTLTTPMRAPKCLT